MILFLKKNPILIFLMLSIPAFLKPSIHGNDGILNYVYLRSLFIDGDIDFKNDYKAFDEITLGKYHLSEKPISNITGKIENRYGIGSSILWSPFWLFARGLDKLFDLNTDSCFDGWGKIYILSVSIASAIYGIFGLFLLFKISEKYWGKFPAWISTLSIWFATPLLFYVYLHPSMSHANAFFLSSLIWYIFLLSEQISPITLLILGFLTGFLTITRFQDFLFVLPVAFLCISKMKITDSKSHKFIWWFILFILPFFIALIPQILTWKILYGSYLSGPAPYLGYKEFKIYLPQHFLSVLFSSRHGLFFWHPILLFGLMGLIFRNSEHKIIKRGLLTGLILEWYLISCWSEWHAGASFGQRFFITTLPAFSFGIAALVKKIETKIKRGKILLIAFLFILWNFGLIFQYGMMMIPREDYISVKTILKNQFIEIPKIIIDKLKGTK